MPPALTNSTAPTAETIFDALPAPGQLVDVRRRRYVVTDLERSMRGLSPLAAGAPGVSRAARSQTGPHHIVRMSSVEDNGLGDELEVIWEREAGARILERPAMPFPGMALGEAFDDTETFDAFLDCVRWGAISDAEAGALQSPLRSGIEAQDYQLDPVARALRMPRVSLLIADDVGLGKTIEAGLVAQELLLRHRARTILVVCPADIQIQWQSEMREKFGLDFRIIDTQFMRGLRRTRGLNVNPWTHYPRLITSMDYLKRDRPLQLLRETLPDTPTPFPRRYDLLIVDEAHNVAPSGSSHYALDSARTRAIRAIAPHFEHKIFLSATPHNGYPESFSALLELLDTQRFARGVAPDREQLGRVLVRRLKSELPARFDGTPRFPRRSLQAIEVDYSTAERELHRNLNRYTRLRLEDAAAQCESLAGQWVMKLLKKRLFSSPQAFFDTLAKHRDTLERGAAPKAAPRVLPGVLKRQIEELDESFADDEQHESDLEDALESSAPALRSLGAEETALLQAMQQSAAQLCAGDAKARALIAWLRAITQKDGQWSDERAIVFTEYRATQKWLHGLLAAAGLAQKGRLKTIYGGMDADERESIKNEFQAHPDEASVRILLATDAASEGINLQNHCSRLVHYEIPWNPNRMEQRNGRVDRHGQRACEVQIFHFVGAGFQEQKGEGRAPGDLEGDLEFLLRAARKVEAIREDLGKVGPVIASQVEEAMLGRRRSLDTARAQAQAEPGRRMLAFERDLKKQLVELADSMRQTQDDLNITPATAQRAVEVALRIAGQPALRPVDVAGLGAPAFELPILTGSWASAVVGLEHPHNGKKRPICFDAHAADGRDDVVLAHLGHRLVALAVTLLRAETWSLGLAPGQDDLKLRRAKINRVAARRIAGARFQNPLVVAHARLVVLGGDNSRLHEEIISAGGALRENRFARLGVGEVEEALGAKASGEVSRALQETFETMWPKIEAPLLDSLEKRMAERMTRLQKTLAEKSARESADVAALLEELARSIRAEIEREEPQQLSLWSDDEQEQLRRNRDGLRRRLEQIPGEIEREVAAVKERYGTTQPRIFPAAVEFLVPASVR